MLRVLPMAQTDPQRSFGLLLHEIARMMRKQFTRRVQGLGLTQAQWQTLVHLSRNEGIRQVALAEIMEIQPITLVRLIDRLQAAGWVERRADPGDRRAFQLYLTAQARPLLDQLWDTAKKLRQEAMMGLSATAQTQMIEALCAIKHNLLCMDKPNADVETVPAKSVKRNRS